MKINSQKLRRIATIYNLSGMQEELLDLIIKYGGDFKFPFTQDSLAHKLKCSRSNVYYSLEKLKKCNLIIVQRLGNNPLAGIKIVFTYGQIPIKPGLTTNNTTLDIDRAWTLENQLLRMIQNTCKSSPKGIFQSTNIRIGKKLDCSPYTVQDLLLKLKKEGLIVVNREGKYRTIQMTRNITIKVKKVGETKRPVIIPSKSNILNYIYTLLSISLLCGAYILYFSLLKK